MNYYKLKTEFKEVMVSLTVECYTANNRLAVQLWVNDEDGLEPFSLLTVNLPDAPIIKNGAYLDTNNLKYAEKFVCQHGLATKTGMYASSGYCTYPLYTFDMEQLKKLDPVGYEAYERKADDIQ